MVDKKIILVYKFGAPLKYLPTNRLPLIGQSLRLSNSNNKRKPKPTKTFNSSDVSLFSELSEVQKIRMRSL